MKRSSIRMAIVFLALTPVVVLFQNCKDDSVIKVLSDQSAKTEDPTKSTDDPDASKSGDSESANADTSNNGKNVEATQPPIQVQIIDPEATDESEEVVAVVVPYEPKVSNDTSEKHVDRAENNSQSNQTGANPGMSQGVSGGIKTQEGPVGKQIDSTTATTGGGKIQDFNSTPADGSSATLPPKEWQPALPIPVPPIDPEICEIAATAYRVSKKLAPTGEGSYFRKFNNPHFPLIVPLDEAFFSNPVKFDQSKNMVILNTAGKTLPSIRLKNVNSSILLCNVNVEIIERMNKNGRILAIASNIQYGHHLDGEIFAINGKVTNVCGKGQLSVCTLDAAKRLSCSINRQAMPYCNSISYDRY